MNNPTVSFQNDNGRVVVIFTVFQRPSTTNAERAGNRYERAAKTKEWRNLFHLLSLSKRLPTLTDANITIDLWQKGRLQDTASCNPSVKAAIDGMVDANLFINDTGDHVSRITFTAPQRSKEDKIVITVEGNQLDKSKTVPVR